MDYEKLKKEAFNEKRLEEDEMWKRRFKMADCIESENAGEWTTISNRPAQEAALAARKEVAEALQAFSSARDALNELRISTEEKMQVTNITLNEIENIFKRKLIRHQIEYLIDSAFIINTCKIIL